jgi:hypothetical protein
MLTIGGEMTKRLSMLDPAWKKQINHVTGSLMFRDWEKNFVKLELCVAEESHALTVLADDICKGFFHTRDWTSSGLPFLRKEEQAWSGFWFELKEDMDSFLKAVKDKYGKENLWH